MHAMSSRPICHFSINVCCLTVCCLSRPVHNVCHLYFVRRSCDIIPPRVQSGSRDEKIYLSFRPFWLCTFWLSFNFIFTPFRFVTFQTNDVMQLVVMQSLCTFTGVIEAVSKSMQSLFLATLPKGQAWRQTYLGIQGTYDVFPFHPNLIPWLSRSMKSHVVLCWVVIFLLVNQCTSTSVPPLPLLERRFLARLLCNITWVH